MLKRRVFQHRGLWVMQWQALHMGLGVASAVAVAAFLILEVKLLWGFQVGLIQSLLRFAHVPYKLSVLPAIDLARGIPVYYRAGGQTFSIPVEHRALQPVEAVIAVLVIALLGFAIYKFQRIPLPMRIFSLFILVLVISTILYTSFISPVPPHDVSKLSVDWQYSGVVILFLISLVFAFSVFPIKGPLWIKFAWLGATLAYGIAWNVVRVSVVLATLHHLGSTFFLILHYMSGIYIDFIYIVAFYSLALAHLASREVSEVGW